MSLPNNSSRPRLAPPWLLRFLSVIALALSLTFFVIAAVFFQRGLTTDTQATIAATMIGIILLIASFLAYRIQPTKHNRMSRKLSVPIRAMIVLTSLVALFGGVDFARMSIIVINQEYLHWFYSSRSYGPSGGSMNALLADFSVTAFVLIGIGSFLFWFAIFHCRSPRVTPDQ